MKLFIPSKIHIGFIEKNNTTHGNIAYLTYCAENGKIVNEKKWRKSIREHDTVLINGYEEDRRTPITRTIKGTPIKILDNVPTSGFIINKKLTDYSDKWDDKYTNCRVLDPRGFEFYISGSNLLYILQQTNIREGVIQGKFIYSWDGNEMVLLPCFGGEYKNIKEFSTLQTMNVLPKNLKEGYVYYTKNQEKVTYMGKFEYIIYNKDHDCDVHRKLSISEELIFLCENNEFKPIKINLLGKVLSTSKLPNFNELLTNLINSGIVLPVENIDVKEIDLSQALQNKSQHSNSLTSRNADVKRYRYTYVCNVNKQLEENRFESYSLYIVNESEHYSQNNSIKSPPVSGFILKSNYQEFHIKENTFSIVNTKQARTIREEYNSNYYNTHNIISTENIKNMQLKKIRLKIKNADKLKLL